MITPRAGVLVCLLALAGANNLPSSPYSPSPLSSPQAPHAQGGKLGPQPELRGDGEPKLHDDGTGGVFVEVSPHTLPF
ncbi:hypothetical protein T484DRAFT_1838108 [Baffinella frigidus]|nr:hypothetical protein T484DRAFT_1838108 [Cryptophyta sp. CCMP2293]